MNQGGGGVNPVHFHTHPAAFFPTLTDGGKRINQKTKKGSIHGSSPCDVWKPRDSTIAVANLPTYCTLPDGGVWGSCRKEESIQVAWVNVLTYLVHMMRGGLGFILLGKIF